jgi:quercetin dioxygenase-like cupin family protein
MRVHISFMAVPLLAVVFAGALVQEHASAQYARTSPAAGELEWENNRLHLRRLSVAPGASLPADGGTDRVLVYLTADPQGGMPAVEAVWQPAGSADLQNRGAARLDAIAVDVKSGASVRSDGTPPEALATSDRADVWRLIDNARVLVTKHRYAPSTYVDALHFHPEDMLVVYLRGGYTWPTVGGWGAYRVRRGEVDVVPANTLHTLGNAGADPLEFLVIMPK